MRRLIIGCAAAALVLAGGALASSTTVQATIPPTEAPPIVGAWLLTVDEFPEDPPELVAFHADGTYQKPMPTVPPASGHGRQPDRPRST